MAKALITRENITRLKEDIDKGEIELTTSYNNWAQTVIKVLALSNRPFKVYNLGAGVKRITTKTDICPCCKRKI